MARPTKFNAERAAKIIDLVRKGNFKSTAARASGINIVTLDRWIVAGREGKTKALRQFCIDIDKAEAEAEADDVSKIKTRMPDSNISQILDYLRRRNPQWNVPDKTESTVTIEDKNVEVIDVRMENALSRYDRRRRTVHTNRGSESVDTDNPA